MPELFKLITPITYWILISLWSFILYFYLKKMDRVIEILSHNLPAFSEQKNPLQRQEMVKDFIRIIEEQYQKQLDAKNNLRFDFLFGPYLVNKLLFLRLCTEKNR